MAARSSCPCIGSWPAEPCARSSARPASQPTNSENCCSYVPSWRAWWVAAHNTAAAPLDAVVGPSPSGHAEGEKFEERRERLLTCLRKRPARPEGLEPPTLGLEVQIPISF